MDTLTFLLLPCFVVFWEKLNPRPVEIGAGPPVAVKIHTPSAYPKDTDAWPTPTPILTPKVKNGPESC
jgi:hypothetical protein